MPSKHNPLPPPRRAGRPRASPGDPQIQISGPNLQRILEARGLTQLEVLRRMAERGMPISASLLNVLVNDRVDPEGRRRQTRVSIVTALSEVLEVHRSWLMTEPLPDDTVGVFEDSDGTRTPITYAAQNAAKERARAIIAARAPASAAVAEVLNRAGTAAAVKDCRGLFVRSVEHLADELCSLTSRRRDLLVSTGIEEFSIAPDDAARFAACVQTAVELLLAPVLQGEAVVRLDGMRAVVEAVDMANVRRFWPEAKPSSAP